MNFLEALVSRTLELARVLEAPRVPFVNAFPEEPPPDAQAAPVPAPTEAHARAEDPGVVPRAAPLAAPPPLVRPTAAAHAAPPPPPEAPANAVRPAAPRPHESHPETITRVERSLAREEPPAPRSDVAQAERPVPPAVAPALRPAPTTLLRERIETHHEHTVVRDHVRERERLEAVESAPAPVQRRGAPSLLPAPRPHAVLPPAPRPTPNEAAAGPRAEAAPPPPLHVSIGRIVVRVQPPPAAPRSEPSRPATPALTLDAYTARTRGEPR